MNKWGLYWWILFASIILIVKIVFNGKGQGITLTTYWTILHSFNFTCSPTFTRYLLANFTLTGTIKGIEI